MSVLHIAHAADWQRARVAGQYRWSSRGSTLDENGFIHCATVEQVDGVAHRFYNDDAEPLVVLVIDEEAIATSGIELKFEDGGDGELFPHVYGAILPEWVTEARPAAFVDDAFSY
ncbi:DUF952 domain-containing protein [soil metagenome]